MATLTGTAVISLVNYSDLDYQELNPDGYVNAPAREDLMVDALRLWRDKQVQYSFHGLIV